MVPCLQSALRSFTDTFLRFNTGLENIQNEGNIAQIQVQMPTFLPPFQRTLAENSYRRVIEQEFKSGSLALLAINIGQDKKNHPMHPSRGHTWLLRSAFGFPAWAAKLVTISSILKVTGIRHSLKKLILSLDSMVTLAWSLASIIKQFRIANSITLVVLQAFVGSCLVKSDLNLEWLAKKK